MPLLGVHVHFSFFEEGIFTKKKIWIVQSGCREGERENEEERTGDTKGGNLPHVLSGLKDAAGRGCLQSECTLESRAGVRGVS